MGSEYFGTRRLGGFQEYEVSTGGELFVILNRLNTEKAWVRLGDLSSPMVFSKPSDQPGELPGCYVSHQTSTTAENLHSATRCVSIVDHRNILQQLP